jgi:glycosyltransferase involved in cell wall biosynthesis
MSSCKVSILLPVYDGAEFLEPLLRSVISQTWDNFELLVLDDGSTDGSWEIVEEFCQHDRRIRAHRSMVNRGQEQSLQILSKGCGGELIMFCDQDDVWEPSKVELLVAAIGESSLVYGSSPLINAKGEKLDRTLFDAVGFPLEGQDCLEILFRNTVSAHALLMKRAHLCERAFAPSTAGVLFDWRLAAAASSRAGSNSRRQP